jgi:hypothetical protein
MCRCWWAGLEAAIYIADNNVLILKDYSNTKDTHIYLVVQGDLKKTTQTKNVVFYKIMSSYHLCVKEKYTKIILCNCTNAKIYTSWWQSYMMMWSRVLWLRIFIVVIVR